jgi:hypothetical protein
MPDGESGGAGVLTAGSRRPILGRYYASSSLSFCENAGSTFFQSPTTP